jgi:hypothetical protein
MSTTTVVKDYHFLFMREKLKTGDMVWIDSMTCKGRIITMTDDVILVKLEGKITSRQFLTISTTLLNTLKKINK